MNEEQLHLLSEINDTDLLQHLLADLNDDLPARLKRFRYLTDISGMLGSSGTMIHGGDTAYRAYLEARWSYIHGNFVATIVLCQSLIENLLAAFLHTALVCEVPERIQFRETLRRSKEHRLINDQDEADLTRLSKIRNGLMHFRNFDSRSETWRRAIDQGMHPNDLLEGDASFSIGIAVRILAKRPFRVGQ